MDVSLLPPPPPVPSEQKILRNIDLLASFVARLGPEFEELAMKRHMGDASYSFLYNSSPGSKASKENDFYQWKKLWYEAMLSNPSIQDKPSTKPVTERPQLLKKRALSPSAPDMEVEGRT